MEKGWDQLSPSYYSILGIDKNSSVIDIRSAYRKLAMQWHPDRWTRNPSLSGEAKRKFQQIQEAYSVLSDQRKRTMYDAGLYDADDEEEDEGFSDFLEEMLSLMAKVRRKGRGYSMEELQRMFLEMAPGFGSQSQWFCGASIPEHSKESKRAQREANPLVEMDSRMSSLEVFGTAGFCS